MCLSVEQLEATGCWRPNMQNIARRVPTIPERARKDVLFQRYPGASISDFRRLSHYVLTSSIGNNHNPNHQLHLTFTCTTTFNNARVFGSSTRLRHTHARGTHEHASMDRLFQSFYRKDQECLSSRQRSDHEAVCSAVRQVCFPSPDNSTQHRGHSGL